jgi:hypothetical protein
MDVAAAAAVVGQSVRVGECQLHGMQLSNTRMILQILFQPWLYGLIGLVQFLSQNFECLGLYHDVFQWIF